MSQELIYTHTDVCAVWLASGVGLAAVLWFGWVGVAGTFAGSFAAVTLFFVTPDGDAEVGAKVAAATSAGAAAEAALIGLLVRVALRGSDRVLDHFGTQLWFAFASLGGAALSAAVGVGARAWYGLPAGDEWPASLVLWTSGDLLGVLLVTPYLLARRRGYSPFEPLSPWQRLAFVAVTAAATGAVFLAGSPAAVRLAGPAAGEVLAALFSNSVPFMVVLLVPLLYSCFYLPQHWTLGAALAVAVFATTQTAAGVGPLVKPGSTLVTAVNLYPFLLVMAMTALTVSTGLQSRVRRGEFDAAKVESDELDARLVKLAHVLNANREAAESEERRLQAEIDLVLADTALRREQAEAAERDAQAKLAAAAAAAAARLNELTAITADRANRVEEVRVLTAARDADRQKLEAERARLKELERNIMTVSPAGIGWSDDVEKRFTAVNKKLAEELGYDSEAELTQLPDVAARLYAVPAQRDELLRKLGEAPDKAVSLKITAYRKDGKKIRLHLYARRAMWEGRRQILGFARDITEGQRRRQQAEVLMGVAGLLAQPLRPDEWVSSALERVREHAEFEGVALWLMAETCGSIERVCTCRGPGDGRIVPVDAGTPSEQVVALIEAAGPDGVRVFPIVSDGHLVAVVAVDGPAGLFSAEYYDNPKEENKATFETVVTTAGRLIVEALLGDLAHERNHRIMQLAEVGIFYADAKGVTTYINPKCREFEGLAPDDPVGEWRKNLTGDTEAEDKVQRRYLADCRANPGAERLSYTSIQTFRRRGADGVRVVQATARPVFGGGHLTGFVGVVQDISDLDSRRVENELALHAISHDTGNALAGLALAVEQIRSQLPAEHAYLADTARACHDDIQALAAVDVRRCDFDCHVLARSFRTIQTCSGAAVEVAIDPRVPARVHGPRGVVSRVLYNLVSNAVPLADSVRVELTPGDGGRLRFAVTSDGSPLDPDALAKVARLSWPTFDLGRWLASLSHDAKGRGLPLSELALRKARADKPGAAADPRGLLCYKRTADGRNAFAFEVAAAELVGGDESAGPPPPDDSLYGRGPVLLVDDTISVRSGLAAKLLSWGVHPLVVCHSGHQAVELVKRYAIQFELVLMDGYLDAGMTGREAATAIREVLGMRPRILSISEEAGSPGAIDEVIQGHIPKTDLDRPRKLADLWPSDPAGPLVSLAPMSGETEPPHGPQTYALQPITLMVRYCGYLALLAELARTNDSDRQSMFDNLRHELWRQLTAWRPLLRRYAPEGADVPSAALAAHAAVLQAAFEVSVAQHWNKFRGEHL